MIGKTLLHYEITARIGAGGMGEVYRATDTKLGREVAIKVLPSEVARDPERLSRFQREATLLAALNHPHIAQVHGLEESDGSPFLVLELVEGEALAERLTRGPIPTDEALDIARQIAEALEEAHEKGIVHRDLKPANVKQAPDGKVKVLDFGLARAYADDAAPDGTASDFTRSPTLAPSGTAAGVILGTAAYMSPEQARGRSLDRRTDVWAFGVVVFEMLTGERLFTGETVSDTLASILKEEPDWTRLPAETPRRLRDLLRRSLRKDVRRRLRDIGDARLEIEDAIAEGGEAASDGSPASPGTAWTRVAAVAAGALAAGVLGTLVAQPDPSPAPPREVTRLTLELPEGWVLRSGDGREGRWARQAMALSPDGRNLVFAATDGERAQLFLRPLDRREVVPIPGTEGALESDAPSSPFFSPDGQSIGFFTAAGGWPGFRAASGQLKRVPLSGGEVRTIAVSGAEFHRSWASWAEDDTILLVARDGLLRIPAQGGTTTQVTTLDRSRGETRHIFPEMLPGGQAVLFNVARGSEVPSAWEIVVQSLDTGERRVLVEGGSDPRYVASGHIVFARSGTLMAVPFDASGLQVTGDPVLVIEDVMHTEGGSNVSRRAGDVQLAVSRAGACAYVPGGVYPNRERRVGWVDREGNAEILPLPPAVRARVSPDGTRVAYNQGPVGERQIWVYDIGLGVPSRLTSRGDNQIPVWSPDGMRVVFSSEGGDGSPPALFWMATDGRGEPERLTEALRNQRPSSWSPEDVLAFVDVGEAGPDVLTLSMKGGAEPEPLLQTRFNEMHPAFSPDGRWLAYTSDATGQDEVYVRPFPAGEPVHRISTEGGSSPVWSPNGQQLFYLTRGEEGVTMMAVNVTAGETFVRRRPRPLFTGDYPVSRPIRSYDISPDGQRFLMSIPPADSPEPLRMTRIEVILNWHEELKRLAPADRPRR